MARIGDFAPDDLIGWMGLSPADYSDVERVAAEFAERFARDHVGLRENDAFWGRVHELLTDDEITDLTLSCALWLGQGRALRVLDVGQACRLTL